MGIIKGSRTYRQLKAESCLLTLIEKLRIVRLKINKQKKG